MPNAPLGQGIRNGRTVFLKFFHRYVAHRIFLIGSMMYGTLIRFLRSRITQSILVRLNPVFLPLAGLPSSYSPISFEPWLSLRSRNTEDIKDRDFRSQNFDIIGLNTG